MSRIDGTYQGAESMKYVCNGKYLFLRQRDRGSVRAFRDDKNPRVFLTETSLVADVACPLPSIDDLLCNKNSFKFKDGDRYSVHKITYLHPVWVSAPFCWNIYWTKVVGDSSIYRNYWTYIVLYFVSFSIYTGRSLYINPSRILCARYLRLSEPS